jgi:hypothetical protein
MMKRLAAILFIVGFMFLTSGCAVNRATASLTKGADISNAKSYYVVQDTKNNPHIDDLIKANLTKRGFEVTTGPEMPLPYKSDVVVSYVDKWMWDMAMYLLELTINFRDPANNFPMAVGNSLHTSLTRKSPEEMVDEVLTNIFAAKAEQ